MPNARYLVGGVRQADAQALAAKETERAEAAAQLERRMAAMEAVLVARRTPMAEVKPEAARGPGADLRFQVIVKKKYLMPEWYAMPHDILQNYFNLL